MLWKSRCAVAWNVWRWCRTNSNRVVGSSTRPVCGSRAIGRSVAAKPGPMARTTSFSTCSTGRVRRTGWVGNGRPALVRRSLEIYLGDPVDVLGNEPVAVTWAPVPGFVSRVAKFLPATLGAAIQHVVPITLPPLAPFDLATANNTRLGRRSHRREKAVRLCREEQPETSDGVEHHDEQHRLLTLRSVLVVETGDG